MPPAGNITVKLQEKKLTTGGGGAKRLAMGNINFDKCRLERAANTGRLGRSDVKEVAVESLCVSRLAFDSVMCDTLGDAGLS